MNHKNIDLDINNYDLKEILNLFNLNINFQTDDLKNAKKIIMKLHPDKSNLDKKYFLFYCKAYKILENIYNFRKKKESKITKYTGKVEYLYNETDENNKLLLKNICNNKNFNFNEWFNEAFDKLNINDDDIINGYGDWLQNHEDIPESKNKNLNMMHETIEQRKYNLSKIVKKSDVNNLNYSNNNNFSELNKNVPERYTSNIFNKLQYEDLKIAHTESVIPVSVKNDMRENYNNIDNLKNIRNSQNYNIMSEKESITYLNNEMDKDNELSTNTAYKLYLQQEKSKENNKLFWQKLKLLS